MSLELKIAVSLQRRASRVAPENAERADIHLLRSKPHQEGTRRMQYGLQTQFTFYTSALLRAEQTRNGRSEGGAWLGPAALSAGTLTDGLVSRQSAACCIIRLACTLANPLDSSSCLQTLAPIKEVRSTCLSLLSHQRSPISLSSHTLPSFASNQVKPGSLSPAPSSSSATATAPPRPSRPPSSPRASTSRLSPGRRDQSWSAWMRGWRIGSG